MQWGYSPTSGSETNVTANFPITFNSLCYLVVAGTKIESGNPDRMSQNRSFNLSQAVFYLNNLNDYSGNIKAPYIAMGI